AIIALKPRAANGAAGRGSRATGTPVLGSSPVAGGTSAGEGRKCTIPSITGWVPFVRGGRAAETGENVAAPVPWRIARRIASGAPSSPERYLSATPSSTSAAASSSASREAGTCATSPGEQE